MLVPSGKDGLQTRWEQRLLRWRRVSHQPRAPKAGRAPTGQRDGWETGTRALPDGHTGLERPGWSSTSV